MRTGKQSTTNMGRELIQHVELRHVGKDPNKARARITLIALEQ